MLDRPPCPLASKCSRRGLSCPVCFVMHIYLPKMQLAEGLHNRPEPLEDAGPRAAVAALPRELTLPPPALSVAPAYVATTPSQCRTAWEVRCSGSAAVL